jgi:hypothetical protein
MSEKAPILEGKRAVKFSLIFSFYPDEITDLSL